MGLPDNSPFPGGAVPCPAGSPFSAQCFSLAPCFSGVFFFNVFLKQNDAAIYPLRFQVPSRADTGWSQSMELGTPRAPTWVAGPPHCPLSHSYCLPGCT